MLCDKLKINGGKTEFVVIGTRQQLYKVHVDSLNCSRGYSSVACSVGQELRWPGTFWAVLHQVLP